jgi:23S rRNA pseudouridine2604 synthase
MNALTHNAPQATEAMRLNKRMAELGLCSRREADEWIAQGWVLVNGQAVQMGQKVRSNDHIEVNKSALQHQAQQMTVLLNKPIAYVSGQAEDGHAPAVTLVRPQNQWLQAVHQWPHRAIDWRGLVPAGRLDIDSTGLLVLTQDGRLARQLIGEDSAVEKEYLVRVAYVGEPGSAAARQRIAQLGHKLSADERMSLNDQGQPDDVRSQLPGQQLAQLRHGLMLDGQPLKPAQVDWQNPQQLRFVLREGKKRQIRRMCEQVGLHVLGLKRIRVGQVVLGQLPLGQWRVLQPGETF